MEQSNSNNGNMEQLNVNEGNVTQEENAKTVEAGKPTNTENKTDKEVTNYNSNLLYEESLGFIPGTLRGRQDPRYVFAKFHKQYKEFDFTNEDVLKVLEEADLLQYLQLLQISKPNKSIDIRFRTEDAADFFVSKHIEIRGKPVPFVRKAKRVLKVVIKGVHPEMTNDELLLELMPYIEHASSIRNSDRHYNGVTFYDGTKQVFVTHLTRHLPRSMKIGNRWCLVFYKDQPVPDRRPPQPTPAEAEAPPSEESNTQMELEEPGRGTSADELSETTSEASEASLQIVVDEPMPEASLTSKRVREPEEEGTDETEKKTKKKFDEKEELDSCIFHLTEIVKELEEGEFGNIPEVLGIPATEQVQRAVGTMIAMVGSTREEASIPSSSRKFYREREQFLLQKKSVKAFHEELKKDDFYPRFLGRVRQLRNRSEQPPP